jgi:5-methylcytosine-specific restriction protein A
MTIWFTCTTRYASIERKWGKANIMNTYLLTWNPRRFTWNITADVKKIKAYGFFDGRWSCGLTKRIEAGDRLFLLRQGLEPRGIMASGYAKSFPYFGKHWDKSRNGKALYIDVRFDALLVPEEDGVLPVSRLQTGQLKAVNWRTQASGISIAPPAASELEELWRTFLEERGQSPIIATEEISTPALYFEGASRKIVVNTYERDPRARKACIDHHGTACFVCAFDFGVFYGELGRGYIHVHHVIPLSEIGERYVVDPIHDLRPVCPNCHAMLHKHTDALTIEDLKIVLKNLVKGQSRGCF